MTSYLTSTAQLPLKKPFEEKKKMVNAWELIQKKTFTKWVNNKLDVKNIPNIVHLNEDLANGVRLIQLLEIIGGESLRPYNQHPTMIFQKMENVNKALDFIKSRGVALTNIGAEDIVNKNLKLVLGMLWTIILRFTIADINQDGKNAKEGLLLWCQRKTASYEEVDVQDFTYSWTDGLALCALIHHHHPELIDWDALDKTDRHGNTALAFEIAEKNFNIPKLLDVEDLCDISKPDERSVMTYVAEYFHAFSALDEFETAGRRVAKFADVLASVWEMKHHYEERVIALMEAVDLMQEEWESTELTDSYIDAKEKNIIEMLDQECIEANTEENDYTVYSFEDLRFGLDLVKEAVQKKSAFIQNQIISRNMTNLTPAQLEEFEQTFRYFDKDNTNTLSVSEFKYALSSLGIVYDNDKLENIFYTITNDNDFATFEQFIRFMVSVTEDKSTPDQIRESFRTMAGDKPYVTELDLKMSQIPMKMIDYLKRTMPNSKDNAKGYDYELYIEQMFN
ncbi:Putative Actinin-like protein [Rhizopus microsporus]|nr:Putative Actinin-like protein [Rhizopus microsporus]